ncbi:hypothetical protein SA496_12485 [Pseudomonas sp. JS3066]|jgi:hypothetical protein|uniref:hypothetical protein n=1 Tax=unclassified Pseudomonas TaxID=196821 RepID=UPI000EA9D791|nr:MULTISPECIES: hypothetical protein [unclassified Pseudomonas]AYF86590.1 hypothetical protein D6Z43_05240 [Pseudomonas sp. DY-1]MDH4654671.1 hypothetical protein [Pseudomonas sp. BN606]MRK23944.1 hypothetical protein [Pseudomonas sp. JG-B]WVK95939.1 hypothetical protein SA496_12485 [Pseudomonas sp. JS3066]
MTSQDIDQVDTQPVETPTAETAPAKPKKQNVPYYLTLKGHDRGQRPGPAPRGSRRSMGKR